MDFQLMNFKLSNLGCKLLGISAGEWALMGCAIGYPQKELPLAIRPSVDEVTRWLD